MATYEQAYREALMTSPRDEVVLETLEVSHPMWETSYYLVNDKEPFVAKLETGETVTFLAVGFSFSMPKSDSSGVQEMPITLSDINKVVSTAVLQIAMSSEPPKVRYRPYLASDPERPQMDTPLVLFLREVKIADGAVTGKASFADLLNRPFVNRLYNSRQFPNLAVG